MAKPRTYVSEIIQFLGTSGANEKKGKTQAEIAQALRVSQATISRNLTAYPELFPISQQPVKPKGYYWNHTINAPVAVSFRPSEAKIPPNVLVNGILDAVKDMSREELLRMFWTRDYAMLVNQINQLGLIIPQLQNSFAIVDSDADPKRDRVAQIQKAIEYIPNLVTYLIGIYTKLGADKRWDTGEAWRIFLISNWDEINEELKRNEHD